MQLRVWLFVDVKAMQLGVWLFVDAAELRRLAAHSQCMGVELILLLFDWFRLVDLRLAAFGRVWYEVLEHWLAQIHMHSPFNRIYLPIIDSLHNLSPSDLFHLFFFSHWLVKLLNWLYNTLIEFLNWLFSPDWLLLSLLIHPPHKFLCDLSHFLGVLLRFRDGFDARMLMAMSKVWVDLIELSK